jgi:hypothetical protein
MGFGFQALRAKKGPGREEFGFKQLSLAESGSIFKRGDEGLDHLRVEIIPPELIQLIEPEVIAANAPAPGNGVNACHYPARQLGIAHVGKDDWPNHGPKRWRYSNEVMKALTISASK